MSKRTCTITGCVKPHRAKGLCATHYGQQNPNKYRKVTVPCDYCGKDTEKDAGRSNRYANLYCSLQCRDWHKHGYSKLPADHPAIWYGTTCRWVAPRPAPAVRTCAWCPASFIPQQAHQAHCTQRCSRKAGKARRRAHQASSPGQYTWTQVIKLHLIANKLCSYCDQETSEPEPDHVIPISRGGRNGIENILPCCALCNADKGDMTPEEWKANRARRNKPTVRTSFDTSDSRFIHLMLGDATGASHRLSQEAHLTCG